MGSAGDACCRRFGPQAETDLLLALRRGAAVWPPLAQVLEQASPSAIDLDDDALASLLGPAAEELAGAGIEVLWPSSLLDDGLKLRAVVTPAPGKLTEAGFGLEALLNSAGSSRSTGRCSTPTRSPHWPRRSGR